MNDTGRSVTEALGGFWEGVHNDPKFIPLDEFMSDKFAEDPIGNLAMHDLVLEDEYTGGGEIT